MSRVPTKKQYENLRILGRVPTAVICPSRRAFAAMLKHGWVEADTDSTQDNGFPSYLRITPAGLRALATALEKYGRPYARPSGEST